MALYNGIKMNDFTKEELEAICYDLRRNKNPWQCGETIIDKIQSMIDNYCEHEKNIWPLYTEIGDLAVAGLCLECNQTVDRKL